MFNHRENLDRKFVLSRISEEEIFHKYLGVIPNTIDFFRNPLRGDRHADCRFYRDSRGVLKFNDFAYRMNIDCFNLVEKLFNVNYDGALKIIAKDFNLYGTDIDYQVVANLEAIIKDSKPIDRDIRVKKRDFTKNELIWWSQQGVQFDTLKKYNVSPVTFVWLNGNIIYNNNLKDPCFAFYFGDYKYKLYFPFRENYRFIQNTPSSILQGYNQLPEGGDDLVITKSMKDVMALSEFDIYAIAPLAEGILMPEEQYEELANRFFNIYTLFDRDRAGIRGALQYKKTYGTTTLMFESSRKTFRAPEEPKDFSDHYKKYGTNYMLELIEETRQIV